MGSVSSATRGSLYNRDGGKCQVCGVSVDLGLFESGHIVDQCLGGSSELDNLLAMCQKCNKRKPLHKTKEEFYKWMTDGHPFPNSVIDTSEIAIKIFWSKVSEPDDNSCRVWKGASSKEGYGSYYSNGRANGSILCHRYAYLITYGSIPTGMYVCHSCDNRLCCNPNHLFLGSPQDNARDMVSKGRTNSTSGQKNGRAKFSWRDICEIRMAYASGSTPKEIDYWYDVCGTHLWEIVHYKVWKHASSCSGKLLARNFRRSSIETDKDRIEFRIASNSVQIDNGCIVWTGKRKMTKGWTPIYIKRNGKMINVKRYLYEKSHGEIPHGHTTWSSCGNKQCVNSEHISIRENIRNIEAH